MRRVIINAKLGTGTYVCYPWCGAGTSICTTSEEAAKAVEFDVMREGGTKERMNYQEVITRFQKECEILNKSPVHVNKLEDVEEAIEARETAISAMQELQQYRQTGTPEECREAREKQTPAEIFTHTNDSDVKIGNITFRKGTKAHKCQCGRLVMRGYKYCPECGQAIDWR